MRKPKFLVLLLCIVFILSACTNAADTPPATSDEPGTNTPSGGSQTPQGATGEPIKIGAVLPLSSSAGVSGKRVRSGMEYAVNEINAAGGIDGRPLEVIYEDTQSSDPALALSAVEKLIHQDEVSIIVGCYGSSASLAALPVCEKNGVVMLEPIATSPAITSGSEWVFRISSTNGIDGEMIGPYLPALGFTKVAYLPVDNDWGLSVTQNYIPVLEANGATTVTVEPITIGETNYLSQLTKIKNSGADSIIITQDIESCATLIRQIVEAGMQDFKILSTSGNNASMVYQLIGEAGADVYFVEYYAEYDMMGAPDPAPDKAFAEAFNKVYSDTKLDYFVVQGATAIGIIKEAVEIAGSTDRTAIRDALRGIKYEGLRGLTEFNEVGQSFAEVVLTKLHADGVVELIDYKK